MDRNSFARSDSDLARAVETALSMIGYFRPDDIKVGVSQGRVTLSGTLEWDHQKRAALVAARAVTGVLSVTDDVVLRFSAPSLSSNYFRQFAGAQAN